MQGHTILKFRVQQIWLRLQARQQFYSSDISTGHAPTQSTAVVPH